MPFRGPARRYQAVTAPDNYDVGDALERTAPRGGGSARIDTSLMEEENRQREYIDRGRAGLAMTPGVRKGGANPYDRPSRPGVGDSPYLEPRSFSQFGEQYSYDPAVAAEEEGRTRGGADAAADEARYTSLSKLPGLGETQAARMVYGRSGTVTNPNSPDLMHQRLAEYIRNPSRESAAAAISAGADLNKFPDRFSLPDDEPRAPVAGTPEWERMVRREAEIKASVNPANDRAADAAAKSEERAAATDARSKQSQAGATRRELQSVIGRRPRASQFVDPLTRETDPAALADALRNYGADSSMTHRAYSADSSSAAEATDYLKSLRTGSVPGAAPVSGAAPVAPAGGEPAQPAAAPAAAPKPEGPEQQALRAKHQQGVAKIRANAKLSAEEKQARLTELNHWLIEELEAIGGGGGGGGGVPDDDDDEVY